MGLNHSFKGKSVECSELEEQYEGDVARLTTQLSRCREDNVHLQERLKIKALLLLLLLILYILNKLGTYSTISSKFCISESVFSIKWWFLIL